MKGKRLLARFVLVLALSAGLGTVPAAASCFDDCFAQNTCDNYYSSFARLVCEGAWIVGCYTGCKE